MSLFQIFELVPRRSKFLCGFDLSGCKFGCEGFTRGFFAFTVRELVKMNGHFETVDARKQILKDGAHMWGTLRESIFSTECFAGNLCARFSGSAQTCFVKGGGFHHGVKGFCVVSLPRLITGFDLDFTTLGYIQTIRVFAPEYIIRNGFEFVFSEWGSYKFGTLNVFINKIFSFMSPAY